MVLLCTNRRNVELGAAGIVVKVLNKQLKEGKYYKKKALVLAVVDRSRARPPLCMCVRPMPLALGTHACVVRSRLPCSRVRARFMCTCASPCCCMRGGWARSRLGRNSPDREARTAVMCGVGGSVGGWVGGACNLYGWSTQVLSPA